jgi:DUF4097 and DUF4098 domain-containing protein YvlB
MNDGYELRVATRSGRLTIIAEPRDDFLVDGGHLEEVDLTYTVRPERGSSKVTVRCPYGTDVVAGTSSGDLDFDGQLGSVRLTTMSGKIDVARVASIDIRAMSGNVTIESCAGECRVKTKSGKVRIGSAGSVSIAVGSGSIRVGDVDGEVHVRAISGTVEVGAGGSGPVAIETMSGKVSITLPPACRPNVRAKSVSGRHRIGLPHGHDVDVTVKTLSGGITVAGR